MAGSPARSTGGLSEGKQTQEEAHVFWCYQLPSAEGGVASRPLHVGGSFQGQRQLLGAALPTPPAAEGFGPGTRSVPLSEQSQKITYNSIPLYTAKKNPNEIRF